MVSLKRGVLTTVSDRISKGLERLFYKLGFFVARRPLTVVTISTAVFAISLLGLLRFRLEARIEKLWADPGSSLFDDKEHVNKYFPEDYEVALQLGVREPQGVLQGDLDAGVLEASVIHQLYRIHEGILAINASDNKRTYSWDKLAFPRHGSNYWVTSILALWEFDGVTILNLTTAEILARMSEQPLIDPWNGGTFSLDYSVSRVERDDNGSIIRASAIRSVYRFYVNKTFDSSKGLEVDARGKDFSLQYGDLLTKEWNQFQIMTPFTWAAFDKESEELINGDIVLITLGYALIFAYVSLNLGRFNRLHGRVWLALAGILSTGMAIGMSFGVCSAIGLFYGSIHPILPFLLLGIGVDDMFVIVQAWDSLSQDDHRKLTIPERLGRTMALAGTSVTVTSVTDFAAFCIGASTILPGLQSFCVYAGVGVFFDLCFQVTFFAAMLALDAARVDTKRDFCLPCLSVKNEDFCPGHPIPERFLQHFFEKYYSEFLLKMPVKVLVIVAALALFGAGVHAVSQLEIHFDYFWFLPEDSPLTTYVRQDEKYFGFTLPVDIYTGEVNYTDAVVQDKLSALANKTANSRYSRPDLIDPWIWAFRAWALENNESTTSDDFYGSLQAFLRTPNGKHYAGNLVLQRNMDEDGEQNITLTSSRFRADTIALDHSSDEVAAMDDFRRIASSVVFPDGRTSFAFHWTFLPLSTNKIIETELLRNILLALAAVFIVTLILIADVFSAFLVLLCVVFTLVDTCLVIHHWGLTINIVTTVMIVMSVGLSVDYSAHIAHRFMVQQGSRKERVQAALNGIGVSVLNGGVSTFLAFVLLAASKSYVFRVFFRVFLASVTFGVFHGLALLPVVLSLIGSSSHTIDLSRQSTDQRKNEQKLDSDRHGLQGVTISNPLVEQNGVELVNGDCKQEQKLNGCVRPGIMPPVSAAL